MSALKYWVWLTTRKGLSGPCRHALLEHFGSPEEIYYADVWSGDSHTATRRLTASPYVGEVSLMLTEGSGANLLWLQVNTDEYGAPVEVQVYLWLEGCDLDCTLDIAGTTLENLTLSFAGYAGEGA